MSNKYNIEYLRKMKTAIYIEVAEPVALDIDNAIKWAIDEITKLRKEYEELSKAYESLVFVGGRNE